MCQQLCTSVSIELIDLNIKKYPIFILKTITEQAYNSMQNKMSLFKNILLHYV